MFGIIALILTAQALAAPTVVKVAFVEALAPKDTTSSERFQKDYDLAIAAGRRAMEKRLLSCGYTLEIETAFYDASDALQARERGAEIERKGAWLIVGPRRSNHYILLTQGAPQTPSVSLMASASEVGALGARHVSLSPLNADMARAAAAESKARVKKLKNQSYISIVSKDCATCVDFDLVFSNEAKKLGIKQSARIEVAGESPDTSAIEAAVKTNAPAFILLPNYSKVSSLMMSRLTGGKFFFVGGDGWGDANFGFVHESPGTSAAHGFSVRGYPPIEHGLNRLDRQILAQRELLPKGGPALGILKSIDGLTEMLCRSRAKTQAAFAKTFEQQGRRIFAAPWGTSLYEITNGGLSFKSTLKRSLVSGQ